MATKTLYAENSDVKRTEAPYFPLKELRCDYDQNASRATLYTTPDGKHPCCFQPDDVEDLIRSLPVDGQLQPIGFYLNGRKQPVVAVGFRRYYAFTLLDLAARGKVDQIHGLKKGIVKDLLVEFAEGDGMVTIPRSRGGRIWCSRMEQPTSPEAALQLAVSNVSENTRKPPSVVDIAYAARRFALTLAEGGEYGLGVDEAGQYLGLLVAGRPITGRQVRKYLQLLTLRPKVLGQLHRGELTMTRALSDASEAGEGRATGPRPGVKHSELRAAHASGKLAEAAKAHGQFSADEMEATLAYIAGVTTKRPRWLRL